MPSDLVDTLPRRFRAALNIDNPRFDLSGLAGWLTKSPERLGADDLLDSAALAFLDAFETLQAPVEPPPAESQTYKIAIASLDSVLQDQDRVKSADLLAAVFLLNMAQVSTAPNIA